MTGSKDSVSGGGTTRYASYDKITGVICWLLIVLVSLHVNLIPTERDNAVLLAASCFALFCYRSVAPRLVSKEQLKGGLDLFLLLCFVLVVCALTGKTASPFVPVIYLILMAASVTLPRKLTYLMAAFSIACYAGLALAQAPAVGVTLAGRIVELFPFALTAHLGTLLASEVETAREEVEKLSLTDDLTELHNMRSFENLALQQEKLSKRYERPFAVCMIDADNLKQVNDKHGHLAGTELIKWTARIIRQNTRECDIAARFGGDEFIIMYEGHDKEQIRPAVERIVRAMAASPFTFEGNLVQSTLSAGIASYPADGEDIRSVVKSADQAMYNSKRFGKNRVSLFGEEGDNAAEASQVGGEELSRAIPEFHRKTAAVHLGESDLSGGSHGGSASLLKDSRKG